ncbi:hypothetical protein [Calothrix sp. NIES-3974]|uniref:hypothetical protein n=1 Tax=Calothrix sp. NIES-3974 TaxID=2005462 RepID=UPI000B5F461E|nr:hypothetical protein [Calothrix sp. NIES-3974]BAZ03446.1 GCN5-related N-acetyltransferase [Calothrix sp. NIES-3974]
MKIHRIPDPHQFYKHVQDYLLRQEATHNLNLGICDRLIRSTDQYPLDNYLASIEDDDTIIGVVMRTPPFGLLLSTITNPDAIPLIIRDVHDYYQTLPGVNAPSRESLAFAQAWRNYTGNTYQPKRATRILQLTRVEAPNSVPGELCLVTEDERELLKTWYEEFCREALGEINVASDIWVVNH